MGESEGENAVKQSQERKGNPACSGELGALSRGSTPSETQEGPRVVARVAFGCRKDFH